MLGSSKIFLMRPSPGWLLARFALRFAQDFARCAANPSWPLRLKFLSWQKIFEQKHHLRGVPCIKYCYHLGGGVFYASVSTALH